MSTHDDLQALDESRPEDRFKKLHRHEAGLDRHYALDLDLVLVEKHPEHHIPAFIEFKQEHERVRFTQAILFKELSDFAPCFVVRAENEITELPPQDHRFTVLRFSACD